MKKTGRFEPSPGPGLLKIVGLFLRWQGTQERNEAGDRSHGRLNFQAHPSPLTLNGDSQPLPLKYDLVPSGVRSPETEPLLRPLLPLSSSPPLLEASRRKRLSDEG